MLKINLINKEESDIKYHIDKFPDGELSIVIESKINRKENYSIKSRIKSADDVSILRQVTDILNRHGVMWELYIILLMSMRMDRVMDFNRLYSLKIVGNILRGLGYRILR